MPNACGFEFQRGLVHHQARADVHDAFHLDQVIGFQGAAGGHQINDGVGHAGERREFHAAVELDQIHVHAFGGEEVAGNRHVLGGHAQTRPLLDGSGVVKALRHGHAHAATRDLQIQRLVQTCAAVLDERVQTGHAHVGAAVFHIRGHIRGAHQNNPQAVLVGRQNQLA